MKPDMVHYSSEVWISRLCVMRCIVIVQSANYYWMFEGGHLNSLFCMYGLFDDFHFRDFQIVHIEPTSGRIVCTSPTCRYRTAGCGLTGIWRYRHLRLHFIVDKAKPEYYTFRVVD